ncbi:MAG TPA: arsenite methyltransferase [Elusimicrobiota bacterium]|nr:arsenite methyltransferase [Elusimicrobiota bacterium]
MKTHASPKTKRIVRSAYGRIAREESGCGCRCGSTDSSSFSETLGYKKKDLDTIPESADLGLGCGNPVALASLKPGETVLDLGSGAGIDCFLAAKKVGARGRVIGVDMTPEMVSKARRNAKRAGIRNVEFRLGEIERLPLPDDSVDIVLSNCVINLATDKEKAWTEIHRVLKPGGRVSISDMVLLKRLPKPVEKSAKAYVGCVAGALLLRDYEKIVKESGLKNIRVLLKKSSSCVSPNTTDPFGKTLTHALKSAQALDKTVASVSITARK